MRPDLELAAPSTPSAASHSSPYEVIQERIVLPPNLRAALPSRWERIGEVLLLRFPDVLRDHQEEICRAYAMVLGVKAILDATGEIEGPMRRPRLDLLWGDNTETVHRENGILFKLDLRRVMFSSGNVDERIRMASVAQPGEVVVDLFAGIGYFALPMAVHGPAERVVACEVNPVAHAYLVENARLNEAGNVEARLGDCRDVAPEGVADRVVLGYLHDTHAYLPKALRVLRGAGWLHYHEACPDARSSRLLRHLEDAAASHGAAVRESRLRRVKSYAPGVSHWVVDALIAPGGTPRSRSR